MMNDELKIINVCHSDWSDNETAGSFYKTTKN